MSENLLTDNPGLHEQQFPDPDHVAARFAHDVVTRFGADHHSGARRTLLDVGCGTGRDAGHLAGLGYEVVGLDSSERVVQLEPGGLLVAELRNGAFFLGSTELLDGARTRTVVWGGVPYTSHTRLWIDPVGFDVLALFDAPGPRTEPPWAPDHPWTADAELGEALSGDRLHHVARLRH
ncbi:methyltransferase domain-containing protein [Actinosynnema sp. NPDC023794]